MARMGFSSAGVTRLSLLTIDDSKDWNGKDITNGGSFTAAALHGAVYYGDMFFEDMECAKCHREFRVGERVSLKVVGLIPTGFKAIPVHVEC